MVNCTRNKYFKNHINQLKVQEKFHEQHIEIKLFVYLYLFTEVY